MGPPDQNPIAALKVMIQSLEEERADLPYVREMKLELFKVKQYVEMVLSYLRMEDMSGDLVFEEYSLDEIVRQAVRKYSRMFILKKIRLDLGPLDHQVLTDEKWLVFVMEQILFQCPEIHERRRHLHLYDQLPGPSGAGDRGYGDRNLGRGPAPGV